MPSRHRTGRRSSRGIAGIVAPQSPATVIQCGLIDALEPTKQIPDQICLQDRVAGVRAA
jgi:hypothetical protein